MNSKQMENWTNVFLALSIFGIILELFSPSGPDGVFFTLLMSTIFNVGSSIMKKLESDNE
ncbi:MAG: hypothetical protein Unbinned5350contig1004_16 [Prokaryotic dsDNA virus sp.]|nr:MAG: hypothetical protein Unbinned5350contig1004_16 [Prokaryotic dsDNA virus sp.]